MEISRQVLQAYSGLKNSEAQASAIKAKLDAVHHEFDALRSAGKGAVSASEVEIARAAVQAQEAALVQSMLLREQTEKELRLLIGNKSAAGSSGGSQSKSVPRQIPQGPIVDQIRRAMGQRTSVDVAEQPLTEWAVAIFDRYHIPIQFHPDLKNTRDPTAPIGLVMQDVPLPSIFQAIEDFNNGQIQFVVRDYGTVLMNREQAEKNGFMPLSEFAKEKSPTAAADDPWERPRVSAPRPSTPGDPPKRPNASVENPFEAAPVKK
jgi:predicted RNA-binding Zn ribbon-like protein